ncbi:MAG TPA: hypothetical protein PKO09_00050 [Anaerolineae bacterium]|nr:hypothetical protein [Anaerolineae bacterium]
MAQMGRDRVHPSRRRVLLVAGAFLVALLLLTGLVLVPRLPEWRFVDSDQGSVGTAKAIDLGQGATAGQTFVARHAGLTGIEFWLTSSAATSTLMTLHLRAEPSAGADLAVASATIPAGERSGYLRLEITPLSDSIGHYYYAWIEAQGPGIALPLAEGASYLDGAVYQDGQPLDAQAAFRLVYAPAPLIQDLLGAVPKALGLLGAFLLLFALPGWALLERLGPARHLSWGERLGLATGIGLALVPLLMLWTALAGLRLGVAYSWLLVGMGAAGVAWKARTWRPKQWGKTLGAWAHSQAVAPDVALLALLSLILASRLLAVRTLEVPLYGDGYQHTMITQLLVDHGGLFDSWQPYSSLDRFTYHFGFHAAAAAVHWLTGLPVAQSVLWTGQILNVLAIVALYPLALRISGSRWGGVACVLVAGLLSPMPSEYVNWGRYTQLAGQVLLPVAAWLIWELLTDAGRRWRMAPLLALVSGGLALTHYRVLGFFGAFALALLPFGLQRREARSALPKVAAAALGAAVLFLPWLVHTFEGSAIRILGHQLSTLPAEVSEATREANAVGRLARYLAPGWWLAGPLALGWALWQRRCGPLVVLLWSGLLVLAANPAWLGLPGTGAISNFAILIAAYIPAGLLVGFLVSQAVERMAGQRLWAAALALFVVGIGVFGALQRLRDLDLSRSAYVTRPDVRAAAWIRANTETEARFLVNSSPAFGGLTIVGTDGGWWLPLLTGRQSTVPPLNYATELSRASALRQQMEAPARLEETAGATAPSVVTSLRTSGVTHVYIGQRQGAVNDVTGVTLSPDLLLRSGAYQAVYHEDRVWIFRLLGSD